MRLRVLAALALTATILSIPSAQGMFRPAESAAPARVVQPPPPAPAPTEPHSQWTNPPWSGLGIHVAWGFETGQYNPAQLASILATHGFKWACLEGSPEHNEPYMAAFRDALHALGLKFCIWERIDRQRDYTESYIDHAARMIDTYHPDFYGGDAEAFPMDDPSFPTEFAQRFPNMPRVWLPAGLPDTAETQLFVKAGWDVMSQDYAANVGYPPVPGITCPVDHDAYWRGVPRNAVPAPPNWGSVWCQHGSGPHTWPIIEVNAEGNGSLASQLGAVAPWGTNFSIWNAENMTDTDWATAASLSK